MNRRSKEVILLLVVLILFAVYIKSWVMHAQIENKALFFIIALSFTGLVAMIYVLLGLSNCDCSSEGYGETQNYYAFSSNCDPVSDDVDNPVSELARMKGGWYLHQGDSSTSKKYRELLETDEGRDLLDSQNCTKGYIGAPLGKFVYNGQTDENWQNPQCQ